MRKMQATNKTSNTDIIGGQLFPVHGIPFCDAILGSGERPDGRGGGVRRGCKKT